jgi:hypothetical protein
MRLLFALIPSIVLATGCSQSTDLVAKNLNACLVVTEAEIELALGIPVTKGERHNDQQCLYHAKRNADETVLVELTPGSGGEKKSLFNSERMKSDRTLLSGIGDGAFTFRSPVGGVQLTFMKGDALVTLSFSSAKHGNPLDAVTNLAKAAAARMPSRLTIAGPTSLGAAVLGTSAFPSAGDWYGCLPVGLLYGKGRLTITERGDWTMTTAVVSPGTMVAERGQWQVESYQEILHGTYQLNGKESFSTTGILSINWDRLAKSQPPSRFDRTLFQALSGMPQKVAVKRLPAVDPALVGSWEGSAKFVDHQEEFVWTITPGNVSQFYRATMQSGRLEQDGDTFKLVTQQGKSPAPAIRILESDKMELTDSSGTVSQWTRNEKLLSRC